MKSFTLPAATVGILVLLAAVWWMYGSSADGPTVAGTTKGPGQEQPPVPPVIEEKPPAGSTSDGPVEPPVKDIQVAETPVTPQTHPPEVPEADLLEYYPVGRTVRGVAQLDISGRGSKNDWIILKADAYFAYRYEIAVKTVVKKHLQRGNGRKSVVFEQEFPQIVQLIAIRDVEVQFERPDSPILIAVWPELERRVDKIVPYYWALKRLAEIVNEADRGLKTTLTRFTKELGLADQDEFELQAKVDQLQGQKFELEYENGKGVTHIRVLQGKPLDQTLLEQVATTSSLLVDYHIFPAMREKKEGDEWTVSAPDVIGLFPVMPDTTVQGDLRLRRGATETDKAGLQTTTLEIIGGEFQLETEKDGETQRAQIKPGGTIWYDRNDLIVRRAAAEWTGRVDWQSKNHLLFGTRNVRNLKIESYYEADRPDKRKSP